MCSRPPIEKWRHFNILPLHTKRFICCTLARLYFIYSMVGRSIASISDLSGIFTSALHASVNINIRFICCKLTI